MPIKTNTLLKNTNKFIEGVKSVSGDTVNKVMITGLSYAAAITPIDTSNLVNSQFREIKNTGYGVVGVAGYRAEYAYYVHDATGEKLRGEDRDPNNLGRGKFWDPNAESEFLLKGFERDGKEEIEEIIRQAYRVKNVNS